MNIARAIQIIPHDAVITATCRPNYYGGAWVVWARYFVGTVEQIRPVTQFAEPFSAARWVNSWYSATKGTA